jgi:hypothetical protein
MNICVCLWYPAKCVKPEKPDFGPHPQCFLNNLYLLVIIQVIHRSLTTMLKYKLFVLEHFFKHFKQIRQFPLVVNIQSIFQKLGLSSILFNF